MPYTHSSDNNVYIPNIQATEGITVSFMRHWSWHQFARLYAGRGLSWKKLSEEYKEYRENLAKATTVSIDD